MASHPRRKIPCPKEQMMSQMIKGVDISRGEGKSGYRGARFPPLKMEFRGSLFQTMSTKLLCRAGLQLVVGSRNQGTDSMA